MKTGKAAINELKEVLGNEFVYNSSDIWKDYHNGFEMEVGNFFTKRQVGIAYDSLSIKIWRNLKQIDQIYISLKDVLVMIQKYDDLLERVYAKELWTWEEATTCTRVELDELKNIVDAECPEAFLEADELLVSAKVWMALHK